MKLNLGCSTDLRGIGWTNVDIADPTLIWHSTHSAEPPAVQVADLSLPWPWPDSSVEEIYAADIFEHIGDCDHTDQRSCARCDPSPRNRRHWSGRIHVMNESWRVLKPGGMLHMECPDAARGAGQWQDPTHVTPWTPNGLQYFCVALNPPLKAWERFREAYGVLCAFRLLHIEQRRYEDVIGAAADGSSVRSEVWKFQATLEAVKNA